MYAGMNYLGECHYVTDGFQETVPNTRSYRSDLCYQIQFMSKITIACGQTKTSLSSSTEREIAATWRAITPIRPPEEVISGGLQNKAT